MRRVALLLLAGCGTPYGGLTGELGDTGWFSEDDLRCDGRITAVSPSESVESVVWTEPFELYADAPRDDWAVRLVEEGGVEVPVDVAVDDTGLVVRVRPTSGRLRPSTGHRLQWTDCEGPHEVRYVTSAVGTPLAGGPDSLRGRAYVLDLDDATWLEPAGFDTVLAAVIAPILVGVVHADATSIAWVGAIGAVDDGQVFQADDLPTWTFPVASFTDAPYVATSAARVDVPLVAGASLRILDLAITGTFAADGGSLEAATVSGLGDTRDAGAAVGQPGEPGAVCAFAASLSAPCVPCPDGEPTCLRVRIERLRAPWVPGLTLAPEFPDP